MSGIAKKRSLPSAVRIFEEFREIALLGFLKVVARIAESEKGRKFS
jgi:hypothetical protein